MLNAVQEIARTRDGRAAVMRLLEEFGIDRTDTNLEQLLVFLEAVAIHDERTQHYQDHWFQNGAGECLLNARRKVLRQISVLNVVREGSTPLDAGKDDDATDGINYLAFFIRCIRAGNIDGTDE